MGTYQISWDLTRQKEEAYFRQTLGTIAEIMKTSLVLLPQITGNLRK